MKTTLTALLAALALAVTPVAFAQQEGGAGAGGAAGGKAPLR